MSNRVEIPAYTDRWMMGDRMGVVIKTTRRAIPEQAGRAHRQYETIAHVKLDISGKTVRVVLDDCTLR